MTHRHTPPSHPYPLPALLVLCTFAFQFAEQCLETLAKQDSQAAARQQQAATGPMINSDQPALPSYCVATWQRGRAQNITKIDVATSDKSYLRLFSAGLPEAHIYPNFASVSFAHSHICIQGS